MSEEETWTHQLDWLNIITILGLKSIKQIPESKKEKALKKLTKLYGVEMLLNLTPEELDELVADQLRELMKKELTLNARRQEKLEREIKAKAIPFKNGGIIPINLNDLKDFDPDMDPEEILKFLSKKFLNDDDEDKDDKKDRYDDDKSFYYI
ncbi:MAG: hypothetical protein ACFFFB_08455 [Candidatus Heimdallarchaeota archaeon]